MVVYNGGWLLHQISFKSGETYEKIALHKFPTSKPGVTVVFDGYSPSPKDHDHQISLKTVHACPDIVIRKDTPCTTSKDKFLNNTRNKLQLIKLLASIFRDNGVNV